MVCTVQCTPPNVHNADIKVTLLQLRAAKQKPVDDGAPPFKCCWGLYSPQPSQPGCEIPGTREEKALSFY